MAAPASPGPFPEASEPSEHTAGPSAGQSARPADAAQDAAQNGAVASVPGSERAEPLRLGSLALASPFVLAPLAGWTTRSFRVLCRRLGGVGLAVTEVVSARALIGGARRTLDILASGPGDDPLAAQISAKTPTEAAEAARRLEARGFAAVDLNLGCPVRKISRKGGGAALALDVEHAARVAGAAARAVAIPVTAKLRLGWGEGELTAPALARALEREGIAALTVHGRTRAQSFAGRACRAGIRAVCEAVDAIPVIANGDVLTAAEALAMMRETGAQGVMIGRGAVEQPWIFRDALALFTTGATPPSPPSLAERLDLWRAHARGLLADLPARVAILRFRKILKTYGLALGAGPRFATRAVSIETEADLEALLEDLAAGAFDPLAPPERPGGLVPTPKRPVDHW